MSPACRLRHRAADSLEARAEEAGTERGTSGDQGPGLPFGEPGLCHFPYVECLVHLLGRDQLPSLYDFAH